MPTLNFESSYGPPDNPYDKKTLVRSKYSIPHPFPLLYISVTQNEVLIKYFSPVEIYHFGLHLHCVGLYVDSRSNDIWVCYQGQESTCVRSRYLSNHSNRRENHTTDLI